MEARALETWLACLDFDVHVRIVRSPSLRYFKVVRHVV